MQIIILKRVTLLSVLLVLFTQMQLFAATPDTTAHQIQLSCPGNAVTLLIDYNNGAMIKALHINGGANLLSASGVTTGILLHSGKAYNSASGRPASIRPSKNRLVISGISYGDDSLRVNETWEFSYTPDNISWEITREYSNNAILDDNAFPKWAFQHLNTWTGGILGNGGVVWCKYLSEINDTYGVHTGDVTLWNTASADGLKITTRATSDHETAVRYSHSDKDEFIVNHMISDSCLKQRYHLSRFIRGKALVFAPYKVRKSKVKVRYDIAYVDYPKVYSRGNLRGINATAVRELLNTTGRYGVVDNNISGGNGWLTNWKCLHEPFFAQIGLALNDPNYDRNLSATLDQERDQAIKPDGRVLSRWHNVPGDEIPGTYNKETGYYEAMWGYTVDSQTGYVINVCEQFDITGKLSWLRSHQQSCEKALNWLIRRDSNHNDIFEMVNHNIAEKTASDWLDIVWASYENAFVNAQMYEALLRWSDCERIMGDTPKSEYYASLALKLKTAFNKPTEAGGFWSEKDGQYVYWRDNDGSIHGNNMVTPVNFAAIAFGICDQPARIKILLDSIEQRMTREKLFHWPLCFDSFKEEEVSGGNWPFPKYENGDIFPTWGYLGVRAYASYNRDIALKYIKNILHQYQLDGLSSQRYSRVTQQGLGDDVLAGISTTITALYRDIYGIRPKWNRMGLEPHLNNSLDGTSFRYILRDTAYQVTLNQGKYELSGNHFSVSSSTGFGVANSQTGLRYFHLNQDSCTLEVKKTAGKPNIDLTILLWDEQHLSFRLQCKGQVKMEINGLASDSYYTVNTGQLTKRLKTTNKGRMVIASGIPGQLKVTIKKDI
ncbi:glucosidase family protein [Chitinophaga pinensis]|uniref:Alpha-L-rhamnosidase six-hairpin glycosidase domain-containing protein n=1 Tax=Chitinophaga pinensis (strain ATCC 43595 / DSM 2588 / LMG 13176 / NBRC 15968 / NCIMB 11800 / UQM 2034) TaxID=485918 RepID=A0A979G2I0_CHIPD|nr:hypothetical protein [Chitinophaga pinensis]ACU59565.1 hypothetical protein Cpin_2072 [Chitinophaga pinensis DSM 2588]